MDGIPPLQERSGQKRGCIDDIIDHMTAEFGGGYEGQYIQFLNGPPQPMPPQVANSQVNSKFLNFQVTYIFLNIGK